MFRAKIHFAMKTRATNVAKSILIAAVLPFYAGCVVPEEEVDAPAPPPDQVEVVPLSPDPGYIWVGGSWEWNNRWTWEQGHWAPPPHPGAVWVRGSWSGAHGHRVWTHSHWR